MSQFPNYDPNNPASEVYLPLSVVVSRLEGEIKELERAMLATKWWQYKQRHIYIGGISALKIEIEDLEKLGGATVLSRMGLNPIK